MSRSQLLQPSHGVQLLQGGRDFFPALIEAVDSASRWVQLETYIFDTNGVGAQVIEALLRAAARGVSVQVLVDGIGSPALPADWQQKVDASGIKWCIYSPLGTAWLGLGLLRPSSWRRLHRKLCVIDQRVVFCGGINVLDDFYDPNHGRLEAPRFDFAVVITGPLALEAAEAVGLLWWRVQAGYSARQRHLGVAWEKFKAAGYGGRTTTAELGDAVPTTVFDPQTSQTFTSARAALVLRDNLRNRASIERAYLKAIGRAKHDILVANAYFVPGGKLRRALLGAARRGVKVTLLLQGKYEYFMQFHAARPVYDSLLRAGIEIHEYEASFLHAKVAVVDGYWATVGSSNLDPLSLLLAREANVVLEDKVFAAELAHSIRSATAAHGRRLDPTAHGRRPWRQRCLDWVAYGLMRAAIFVTGKRY